MSRHSKIVIFWVEAAWGPENTNEIVLEHFYSCEFIKFVLILKIGGGGAFYF